MQHDEGIDSLFCVLSELAVTRRVQKVSEALNKANNVQKVDEHSPQGGIAGKAFSKAWNGLFAEIVEPG